MMIRKENATLKVEFGLNSELKEVVKCMKHFRSRFSENRSLQGDEEKSRGEVLKIIGLEKEIYILISEILVVKNK